MAQRNGAPAKKAPRASSTPKTANPRGFGPACAGLLTREQAEAEISRHRWPHYVYALCTHTGAAFYIGKGTGRRLFSHAAEAKTGDQSAKCQMIRLAGDRLRYSILAVCRDEAYALGLEAALIHQSYDDLTNVSRGAASACLGMLIDNSDSRQALEAELLEALALIDASEARLDAAEARLFAAIDCARAGPQ